MDCKKMIAIISDFLDNELSDIEKISLQAHMEECEDCLALYRSMEELLLLLKHCYCEESVPVPKQVSRRIFYQLRIHYKK